MDLFSGCGGLSLGFQRAGFDILGGVEKEPRAAWTYAVNLHRHQTEERRALLGRCRDIRTLAPCDLLRDLGFRNPESAVDILVGGPPCQAYARVGRAKLREIQDHPYAFQRDERGQLYLRYLEYVRQLQPLALVIENVPDILSYGGRNIALEIAGHLRDLGYLVNFGLLNAASYGVPQIRRRVYLIALCQNLDRLPSLPPPTHRIGELPTGYREFAALAAALRKGGTPFCGPAPEIGADVENESFPQAVTVREAIEDLPRLTSHLEGSMRGGRRRFDKTLPYASPPLSWFAAEMREEWPDFEGGEGVRDQVTRLLPRDHPIFARMMPGDDYPKAHRIALELFERKLARLRSEGQDLEHGSTAWELLKKTIVPPYDPTKFPNKWRKLDPDAPARTLLAHLAHDSYTHIHYDDVQARTLSVREAARLQSFPDGFRFYEAMNPALRMIGNAVPPMMAFRLAQHLLAELRAAVSAQPAVASRPSSESSASSPFRSDTAALLSLPGACVS
ncbi:MAG: DNA cytosine methyltransferase [Thermoanaerobaculia bacterium]